MNPFRRREAPTPAPEISSATEAIRQRLHARLRKIHLSRTAADLSLPLQSLENFATGAIDQLPEAAMHALCKELYPYNTKLDFIADRLVDTNVPLQGAPHTPEPYVNPNAEIAAAQAAYKAAVAASRPPEPITGPRPVPPISGRPKRPGFAA